MKHGGVRISNLLEPSKQSPLKGLECMLCVKEKTILYSVAEQLEVEVRIGFLVAWLCKENSYPS